MSATRYSLSTAKLNLEFRAEQERLQLDSYGLAGSMWLNAAAPSGLFAVYVNGMRYDANTLAFREFTVDTSVNGTEHSIATFDGAGFTVEHHVQTYADTALVEQWQVIRASTPTQVTRVDSFALDIAAADYELLHFTSDWGQEFQPVRAPLAGDVTLETHYGRSSKGMHPWFALFKQDTVLSASIAWSGNWVFRFEPTETGYRVSGGLHDWQFSKTLAAGESFETPRAVMALGRDLNDTAQQYARVGRRWWYPRNAISSTLPVEWNHWWSYNDLAINEQVFLQNIEVAARLGVEICTLDAGWFGPTDAANDWYSYRGDWHLLNTDRFPNGVRPLADAAHAAGMKFGVWCEIEGLGKLAALADLHPELVALRREADGTNAPIGYVCMGSPAAQEWAYNTLTGIIRETNCDWIKLDFNLEPGAGCNRTDHGHGAGDGLYAHYTGYFALLDRLRADYPDVVLENCASGGLRIDLAMLRHTHLTFLSDPDYPVHNLQVFWGATQVLAADACLHWSYSEWYGGNEQQKFNPRDPNLQPHQLDYYTRTAMLGAFGYSQKLPELPDWVAERLATHTRIYKDHVRAFVREADLYHLTGQPRRDGDGERWSAFQYRKADGAEHLLFVFRLPGGEAERRISLYDLEPERVYQIAGFEGETYTPMTGDAIMRDGIPFALREEESALVRLF